MAARKSAAHLAMCAAWDELRYYMNRMHEEHAEITQIDMATLFGVITSEVRRWNKRDLDRAMRENNGKPVALPVHIVYTSLGLEPPGGDVADVVLKRNAEERADPLDPARGGAGQSAAS